MLTTFSLGKTFNVITGSYIMRADGIQRLVMVRIMGWVKCALLGMDRLHLSNRYEHTSNTSNIDIKIVAMH